MGSFRNSRIIKQDGFYLRMLSDRTGECQRAWIFDADDTLWEDNVLFEEMIESLITYLQDGGCTLGRRAIREVIDTIEHEIVAIHGFGARGFDLSLRRAFEQLRDTHVLSLDAPKDLFERIVPTLTNAPYTIIPGTEYALKELKARGDALTLYTKGPEDIQLGKIERSGLGHYFDCICVVSTKDAEQLKKLLSSLPFSSSDTRCGWE